MRTILREQGTVSNRDFKTADRKRTQNYRGRKDSALALYYLWRSGEVMTHHRENFERVYALAEAVAPAELLHESSDEAADRFVLLKDISFNGLSRLKRTADAYFRGVPFSKAPPLQEALLAEGEIVLVKVEGWKFLHYALAQDVPLLQELAAGRIPAAWTPLETDTTEEAVFLSPLDPVSARGQAKILFGFDYVWEVYKPQDKRKYGYYTLPILWGDQLVARFDSKYDRPNNTLIILGFWLEDEKTGRDPAFATALSRAFTRFTTFLGAEKLDATAIEPPLLRQAVEDGVKG
jgi:uncharacterized protein YcaQ